MVHSELETDGETRYTLSDDAPTVDEYCRLRAAAGLSAHSAKAVAKALPSSWAAATVRLEDGTAVGMGRVIGDDCFFLLVDMAVDPKHQRRGLGTAIMALLMKRLIDDAEPDALVSLIADPPGQALYRAHGFEPIGAEQASMTARVKALAREPGER